MKTEMQQVREGTMSFTTFVRATEKRWLKLATTIVRRWRVPSTVTVEDVVQELLMSAWSHLPKWEEGRAELDSYVVFMAMADAKRWIHRQRGANLHEGDRSVSAPVYYLEDSAVVDAEVAAAQEEIVDALKRLSLAMTLTVSAQQRLALDAVARTGSIDGAANRLRGVMTRRKVQEALHRVAAQMG